MHIPSTMLGGQICPVTLGVGAAGLAATVRWARHSSACPSVYKFAAVTALVFALQMLNYPVQNGTSGHLVGGMLAVSLLNIPFAMLAMSLVLFVQAVFFGDGGINALGANIINMAFLSAGMAGFLYEKGIASGRNKNVILFLMSWLSVMLGAMACSVQVAASGAVPFAKALPAMLSVHALIGVGEGVLTVGVVYLLSAARSLWSAHEKGFASAALCLAVVAALLSPLASSFPDGLEWVSEKLSFIQLPGFELSVLFPDYQVGLFTSSALATIAAGLIGVAIVCSLALLTGQLLAQKTFSR